MMGSTNIEIAPELSLCLFKETRIGNEAVAGSIIQIEVPSVSAGPPFIRNSHARRRILQNRPTFKDDENFTKNLLATSGSIYFSATDIYPRSIVWRTFQHQKVLELRSADLSKNDQDKREATIVLQLVFPSAIIHGGVAFAEAEDRAYLCLFVLTKGLDLYTFTLRRDLFCSTAASEEDISKWCKNFKPSSFTISTPYKLFAGDSRHLVISLSDGRLLHLTRKSGDDGSMWQEITYSDGQWGSSLRSLVRWQGSNTVRFDGAALDQDTPTGLAFSPDLKHAFVVCLNHTFKIWNLDMARSVFSRDLLDQKRDPQEIPKMMLDPGTSHRVEIFRSEYTLNGDLYYVMILSPHNLGQFKIWAVRDPDEGALGVHDLYPELTLRPPDPDPSPESKAIWKVADFKVNSATIERKMEIWVLMRSNKFYRLYNLKFDMDNFATSWKYDWTMTVLEPLDQHPQPHMPENGPEDVREVWLSFFLHPGRYPETVLETALSMYTTTRKLNPPKKSKSSLQERIASLIASNVRLQKDGEGNMNFEKYYADINREWYIFLQDVRDLTISRWDVLAFSYDRNAHMPWIFFADGYSAVRDCSKIEIMAYNSRADLSLSLNLLESPSIEYENTEPKLPDELAVIIQAAATFRQSLDYSLRQTCNTVLTTELWQDPVFSVPVRMQAFYDRCNFAEEITAKCISDLEVVLEPVGSYRGLETESFLAILDELTQIMSTVPSNLSSSKFGLKLLVEGAQGMIDLHERILIDLLVMLVFINAEVDREETSMENLEVAPLYVRLLDLLRQYQMMQWLAKNVREEKDHREIQSTIANLVGRQTLNKPPRANVSTILENLFAVDPKPQSYFLQPQSTALTRSIQDLLRWTIGGNAPTIPLDRVLVYVQCNLLANNNITLASDFLRYQPSTAWATYIKGRLYLVRGEFTEAAIYFKKAAYILSRPKPPTFEYQSASHNLLSSLEAAHFGYGPVSYYTHILTLFESSECHSYSASFAQIALQLSPSNRLEQTTPLLVSLFHASLSLQDFSTAYSVLSRHPDPTDLLPSLVTTMVSNNEVSQLLSFPFPPNLHSAFDAFLLQKAQSSPVVPHPSSKGPKYYEILSTWRLRHQDFRGAAEALLQRLRRLQDWSNQADRRAAAADGILQGYLAVINLLACAGEEWVLSEADVGNGVGDKKGGKRRVVTIQDMRKGYQDELDRRSVIDNGQFGFGNPEVEEVGDLM